VPRPIATFVFGTQGFNLSGSSLYVGAATVFILQASGWPLHDSQWAELYGISYVLCKAISSVPRGSFIAVAAALQQFGVAPDVIAGGIGILLGVDALLDMTRTGVNVFGHCVVAYIVGPAMPIAKLP
jgi:proton glutamate symport protein